MAASHKLVRLAAAAIVSLILGAVTAPGAIADDPIPPVSVSPSPIVLSNGTGVAKVRNQTALRLFVEFTVLDANGHEVETGIHMTGTSSILTPVLEPGGTILVTFMPKQRQDVQFVVQVRPVSAALPVGAVIRTPIATAAAVAPAVDRWTSTATYSPFAPASEVPLLGTSAEVPLDGVCSGLGIGTDPVGTLQAGGRSVPVTATCDSTDARTVRLSFGSIGWDRWRSLSYEGALDLTPANDATGKLNLTLVATFAPWIVALAYGIALLAAFGVERWTRIGRARSRLKAALADINGRLVHIDAHFQGLAKELGLGEGPTSWSVRSELEAESGALDADLTKASNAAELEPVARKVDDLGLVVTQWLEFPRQLKGLADSIDRLRRVPVIAQKISDQTTEPFTTWSSAEMRARISFVATSKAFALDWPYFALEELHARSTEPGIGPLPAVDGLFTALALEESPERARLVVTDLTRYFQELETAERAQRGLDGLEPTRPRLPGFASASAPANQAAAIRRRVAATDWVLALLAVAVLLAAGLTGLLKDGDAFGWWSVIGAVTAGLGAGAVTGPVSDAIVRATQSAVLLRG